MKVLCGRAAALFAGGDFGDYQNVRAITEPDGGVKKFLYVLWGGTSVVEVRREKTNIVIVLLKH